MKKSSHECKFWRPTRKGWRGYRWCDWCGARQVSVQRGAELKWEPIWDLRRFAERWLPAVSGTDPEAMMTVKVAFPFEWNTYESWNIVYRVRFHFDDVTRRVQRGLGTRTDVMNGWQSGWHEVFNRVDAEAEKYYLERTGRAYDTGDNTYAEMRRIIQS